MYTTFLRFLACRVTQKGWVAAAVSAAAFMAVGLVILIGKRRMAITTTATLIVIAGVVKLVIAISMMLATT